MPSRAHFFPPAPLQAAQTISLAHISDPHLPLPSIPWTSFFLNKRLLSALLWRIKRQHCLRPDINKRLLKSIQSVKTLSNILVSGDITNFGTYEEYLSSRSWLQRLPAPPIVVPGNHDIMVPITPEKSLALWKEWSGESYPFVRLIGHVAIIGLNSALPTPPFTAYGYLSKSQLLELESLLETLGKQGYCRVVMIHHPPKKGLLKKQKSLLNTNKLSRILQRRGAELVVHGHSHNATVTTVENTDIPLVGIGAASMYSHCDHRQASWNHFIFTPQTNEHHIQLMRYNYEGEIMTQKQWSAPIGGLL
ncbi:MULTISPECIES: metallophosphoesterase [unclassified Saccharibacter]|uniref:metallophosphoesterase family protein n=1 Tax=unclassified Saccharibacter TaxID=2648722 RepID=UPI001EF05250|nr:MULTISPECIES: metallophosphoesterase [unclassified Saccharibacter]